MEEEELAYRIEEVCEADSAHLPRMIGWLNRLFPDYSPHFEAILRSLRHEDGRHEAQIFVGLIAGEVAGLVQVFYRPWLDGLIADIDLLGVLGPHRRSGLGSALVWRAIRATEDVAARYARPAVGVVSLIDPHYSPVVRLHRKLGGQVRTDLRYKGGDLIVWYPLQERFRDVETKALAWQLWQFGGLPEGEFIRQYGKP